jgi:uncharacterized protein (DUF305 family)
VSTRNRPPIVAVVAVAVIAVALVGVIGCTTSDLETAEPAAAPGEADIGFARDMAAHHAQAVDMAERIRSRTADPRLRSLATDIVLTQQAQIGRMQGWLELWGEPLTSTARPMEWAAPDGDDTDHESGENGEMASMTGMPGMAGPADLAELDSLELPAAERRFLELMIEHHRGGVEMADSVLATEPTDVVATLARSIVTGQAAEIELMETMLADRTEAGS